VHPLHFSPLPLPPGTTGVPPALYLFRKQKMRPVRPRCPGRVGGVLSRAEKPGSPRPERHGRIARHCDLSITSPPASALQTAKDRALALEGKAGSLSLSCSWHSWRKP
jgi:hypothetical protein